MCNRRSEPENLGLLAQAPSHLPLGSGISLPIPPGNPNRNCKPPPILDLGQRALQRLVSGAAPQGELPSLIETVVSNMKTADIVGHLQATGAQTLVDVLDRVWCSAAEEQVHC